VWEPGNGGRGRHHAAMGLPCRLRGFGRCCAALLAWLLGLVALPAIGPELPAPDGEVIVILPAGLDELPAQRQAELAAHPSQAPPAVLEAIAASSFSQLPAGALRAPGLVVVVVATCDYDGTRVPIQGYVGTSDPVNRWDPSGLEWILNSPHDGLAYATEDTDTIQGLAEKLVREGLQRSTEGAVASMINLNPNPVGAFVNDGAEASDPFVNTEVGVGAGYTVDIDADSGFQIAGVGDHVFTTLINESVLLRRSTASLRTEYATVLADLQAAINARQELEEGSDAYAEANRRVRSLSVDRRRLKSRFGEFSEGYIARVKGSLQGIPDSAPQWLRYFTVGLQGLDSLSISNTRGAHGTSSSRGVTIAESTFASDNRSMSLLSTIIHESLHQYYDTLESEQPAELRAAIEAYKNRTITDEQRDLMRYYGNLEHAVIYADEASAGLLLFGDVPDRMKGRLREFDDGRYEFVRPRPDRYLEMVLRHRGVEYDDSGLRSLPSTYDLGGVYGVVNIPELPYIPFAEE